MKKRYLLLTASILAACLALKNDATAQTGFRLRAASVSVLRQNFVPFDSTEYFYTSTNSRQLSGEKSYLYEKGVWTHNAKSSHTYDAAGMKLATDQEIWHEASGTFRKSARYTTRYDAAGHDTFHLTQFWDNAGTSLGNSSRIVKTLDGANRTLVRYDDLWDGNTSSWTHNSIHQYAYNPDGTMSSQVVRTWSSTSNGWLNRDSVMYTWHGPGRQASETLFQWNVGHSQWIAAGRNRHLLDISGADSCTTYEGYVPATSTWMVNSRSFPLVRILTATGPATVYNTEVWDAASSAFVPWTRETKRYDQNDLLSQTDYEHLLYGQWKMYSTNRYYYEQFYNVGVANNSHAPAGLRLSLSPNPARASTNATFDWEVPQTFQASVRDLSGRTLQRYEGGSGTKTISIDVSGLPSGNYILQVNGALGITASTTFTVH